MVRRLLLIGLFSLLLVTGLAISQRHWLLVQLMSFEPVPELAPRGDEGPGVRWADDYYTVEALDERTFAIGEPRYLQQNFNYLIVGNARALLFDAGTGARDIRPIAESLTDLEIVFVPSHFHYDHVGNGRPFERVAIVDLPGLRERAAGGQLTLSWQEHLGAAEGFGPFTTQVDEWIDPRGVIELGERSLEVLYTPGHTWDSISLYDREANFLFAGDFLYEGDLYAFLPTSVAGDYQQGAEEVLGRVDQNARIFGAHRVTSKNAPELAVSDVRDLSKTLERVRNGTQEGQGIYPVRYEISDGLGLLLEPEIFQSWDRTHPELAAPAPGQALENAAIN